MCSVADILGRAAVPNTSSLHFYSPISDFAMLLSQGAVVISLPRSDACALVVAGFPSRDQNLELAENLLSGVGFSKGGDGVWKVPRGDMER